MATVYLPTQLREAAGGNTQFELPGSTVRELVSALAAQHPGIEDRLIDDNELARGLAVSIDGSVAPLGLLAKVKLTSEVHFLPAIGGG
ncbi:MAG: MoaD/ThiS family protein [Pirellulales bacterium]|nr:MoaD/ThiS family protein [Pirellulales bacterium]